MADIEKDDTGADFESPTIQNNDEAKPPAEAAAPAASTAIPEGGATAVETGAGEGTAVEIDPDSPLAFIFADDDDDSAGNRTAFQQEYAQALRNTDSLVTEAAKQAAPLSATERDYMATVRAQLQESGAESAFKTKAQAPVAASSPAASSSEMGGEFEIPADAPAWLRKTLEDQNARIRVLTQTNDNLVNEKREEREVRQRAQFDAAVSDPAGAYYVAPDLRDMAYAQVLAARKTLNEANQHRATRLGDMLNSVNASMPSLVQKGKGATTPKPKKQAQAKPVAAVPKPKAAPSGATPPPVVDSKAGTVSKDRKPAESLADAADNFRESAAGLFGPRKS